MMNAMDGQPKNVFEPLHFKNPPIVEAVIGINVAPLSKGILDPLRELSGKMSDLGYKEPLPITLANFQVKIQAGGSSASATDASHGWQFDSADGLYQAKMQLDGFFLSRLGKYETWELFRGEAKKLWDLYAGAVAAFVLKEFGIRYINKVFVPVEEDLSKYITCYPMLPDNMPPTVLESYMRLVMPIENPDGKLTHQHILLAPEKPGFATVILDNDFRFPASGLSSEQLWANIESVRYIKDDYFCKFVTPTLRDTFND